MNPPLRRAERRAAAIAEHREHRDRTGAAQRAARARGQLTRRIGFAAIVVVVLGVGGFLAFGDLFGRGATPAGAISVQASMAGFTPSEIRVKVGQEVTLDFWTQDSPMHLRDGVHTMISQDLGLHEELVGAAAGGTSRVAVRFTAPMKPGMYDVYCDTCCGGRESPTMHGKIVVEA